MSRKVEQPFDLLTGAISTKITKEEMFNMNGWTNYETWNFMLWEGDYFHVVLQEMKDEGHELTHEQVYEMIEEHIDQMLDEKELEEFLGDIVGHAIQKIDIHEIVESLLEDL